MVSNRGFSPHRLPLCRVFFLSCLLSSSLALDSAFHSTHNNNGNLAIGPTPTDEASVSVRAVEVIPNLRPLNHHQKEVGKSRQLLSRRRQLGETSVSWDKFNKDFLSVGYFKQCGYFGFHYKCQDLNLVSFKTTTFKDSLEFSEQVKFTVVPKEGNTRYSCTINLDCTLQFDHIINRTVLQKLVRCVMTW